MDVYLSAEEAAAILDISKPTLYAYVSRGLIRSLQGKDSRSRLYNRLDIDQLKARKRIRSRPQSEVQSTLLWGAPILDSALTLIANENLYYRGANALDLARTHSFWEVACWFWTGSWDSCFVASGPVHHWHKSGSDPFQTLKSWLSDLSSTDPAGYHLQFPALGSTGAAIVRQFLAILTRKQNPELRRAAGELQECWCRSRPGAQRILNAVLILTLDHELNVSSFTARVVTSAGSNIYEIVSAAMCAFSGSRHGRASTRAELLLRQLLGGSVRQLIYSLLRSGEEISGFGHPAYPGGDPRAKLIFQLLKEEYPDGYSKICRVIAQSERTLQRFANLDMALAAAGSVLGLPSQAGFHLFALGRLAGWIGHAAEQNSSQTVIRPRARYIGVMPKT
ncbi:MAG TPA: citrate synthase family protein [Chthoniobacterales bacterium]|jgi:citrate synthase|nr:citrate synthase family protein [Chthoniobacterales bacterium]